MSRQTAAIDMAAFVHCCQQETALLQQLYALLQDEQKAVVVMAAAELVKLAAAKEALLTELAAAGQARAALMRDAGLVDDASLRLWLGAQPEALSAWTSLESALTQARAYNDVNAALAAERADFADAALGLLVEAARTTGSYGRDGAPTGSGTSSRKLGSA